MKWLLLQTAILNPETSDRVMQYLLLAGISFIALIILVIIYVKKKR